MVNVIVRGKIFEIGSAVVRFDIIFMVDVVIRFWLLTQKSRSNQPVQFKRETLAFVVQEYVDVTTLILAARDFDASRFDIA